MKTRQQWMLSLIAVLMLCVSLISVTAHAEGESEGTSDSYAAWIGNTGYETLEAAVNVAPSGSTIRLGEGKYTLYKKGAQTKGKDLVFVGAGIGKTEWGIGATVPDPSNFGTEYNGDYSFDGAGSITFQNMTLQSSTADYLGFIRADKTIVENCEINGKTFYWGYTSATFKNTTFNAPSGDYAIWTYSSPTMAFDGYTFQGWNTAEDGSGTAYQPDDTLEMPESDVTLYAQWEKNETPAPDNNKDNKDNKDNANDKGTVKKTTAAKTSGTSNKTAVPKTADTSHAALYLALAAVCAAVIVMLRVSSYRRNHRA